MKPNTSQSQTTPTQFSFKPQQFICAKSASGTPTVYTTTNGGVPMKVLLVNALPKPIPATTTAISTTTTAQQPIITNPITTRPIVNIQPKPATIQTSSHPIIQSTYRTRSTTAATANAHTSRTPTVLSSNKYLYSGPHTDTSPKRPLTFKQKATPGFRTLLNQLVQMQSKQLEVSRQRLEIERERLDFERNTGDKILIALTSLLQQKVETKDEK